MPAQIPDYNYRRVGYLAGGYQLANMARTRYMAGNSTQGTKRSRQEYGPSFNATRAKSSYRNVTRVTRTRKHKTRKAAVSAMPKYRIGKDNGLIVSNQKVPRPKKGSVQYRRAVFGTAEALDKVWLGGSSIGQESTHFKTIAHAILAHYLPRMGDLRSTNTEQALFGTSAVFLSFQVKYGTDTKRGGLVQFKDGALIPDDSYEALAITLGAEMAAEAEFGYYPASIRFLLPDGSGNVLMDTNLGRHKITVMCKGRFRFQNVTAAGGESGGNINAIDANPVSGKIFTFRNQAPLFQTGYMQSADALQEDGFKLLNTVKDPFEMYGTSHKGDAAFTPLPAAPLNPSSVWRNVSSTGNAVFPPGGFKTFTTSYLRSETIATYCKSITQVDNTGSRSTEYPPAGDSFMMCLRPTIKTTSELIKIAYDTQYTYMASITRRKASPLQVVNDIE